MTLAAGEFIWLLLQYTVQDGFHRIRHIGFLANAHRSRKLRCAGANWPVPPALLSYRERHRERTGERVDVCPECGDTILTRGSLTRCSPQRPCSGATPS